MTVNEMESRFKAYDNETHAFIFGEWASMTIAARDAKQSEIDARHGYKHGWIIVNGESFSRYEAFPNETFANVWD